MTRSPEVVGLSRQGVAPVVDPNGIGPAEGEDVVAVLRHVHAEALALLDELVETPSLEAGGTPEDVARRASVADALVRLLSAHEAAEEEVFWPAVADAIDGGPSIAQRMRSQERAAKIALDELRQAEKSGADTFDARAARVAEMVREHVASEEAMLEQVTEQIAEPARRSLGDRVAAATRRGPTRPHPRGPSGAAAMHVAGPLVAGIDRLRDTLRRRPADELGARGAVRAARTPAVGVGVGGIGTVTSGSPLFSFGNGQATAESSGYDEPPPRVGFFTDTSVCIGCKACEVACKEWNHVPEDGLDFSAMSYDNTKGLGADTWRHVAFIEQRKPLAMQITGGVGRPDGDDGAQGFRWLMSSDVCKHCTEAACLDVCPTGAIFRTEFGTVVVQEDICNGCGYCVPACPYGVVDQRKSDGRVWKCTLCYDRLGVTEEPACAKACPTDSIQFGPLEELRERADVRIAQLHQLGVKDARLYGRDPGDGVGGDGAFFLLLDEPEVYGLPPDPVVTTRDLPEMWARSAVAAVALAVTATGVFFGRRR